jgi:hypothetical protein
VEVLPDSTTLTLKNAGWQALGKLTYLIKSGAFGYIKAGTTYMTTKGSMPIADAYLPQVSLNKWVPTVALGFGVIVFYDTTLTFQYQHLFGNKWTPYQPSSYKSPYTEDVIMLTLGYRFGNCL